MELNTEKIKRIKDAMELSWADIARAGGLKFRQHAFDKYKRGSIKSAEFFGKVFNMDPKEFIK